ncbi:hypothetical protein [Gordonia polyisoprenivorans]|uniref:hypothetical protein n=1 Tax=Gordonia polyisoprenivorans TaxID=84595 RepID=UPI0022FFD756|nr:hypothetical protein [Gordonia polyisoprenivorans]WCB38746.1 hypothetical protein PHA63_06330 [Gordonia polyisoprenivorans]
MTETTAAAAAAAAIGLQSISHGYVISMAGAALSGGLSKHRSRLASTSSARP